MQYIVAIFSFVIGVLGTAGAVVQWGNHLLEGGYHGFSWPQGWAWPILVSVTITLAGAQFFNLLFTLKVSAREWILFIGAPWAIGAVLAVLVIFLLIRGS